MTLWTMGLILLVISFAFVLFVRWLFAREDTQVTAGPNTGRGVRASLLSDRIATGVFWVIGGFVVFVLGAIIVHFLIASIGTSSLEFLFGAPSRQRRRHRSAALQLGLRARADDADHRSARPRRRDLHIEYAGEGRIPNFIRLSQLISRPVDRRRPVGLAPL
jgi:hypothetical protein